MHGTGTQAGDKAEMGAISSVFSKRRDGELLLVGAIKANIGHSGALSNQATIAYDVSLVGAIVDGIVYHDRQLAIEYTS
jgi:3-oxoacyl-(acyl-carrier-protein) synthase